MPYTPSATDGAAPLDGEKASTAAAEFRTLKTYIQASVLKLAGGALTGAIGITYNGYAVIVKPGVETSYSGFIIENAAASRQLELVYIGSSGASAYGGVAGDCVINVATGRFILSTNDTAAITIGHTGLINAERAITTKEFLKAYIGGANGAVNLQTGNGANAGYIEFFNPDTSRKAYLGFGGVGAGNPTIFNSDDSSKWQFMQNVIAPAFEGALVGNASTATLATTAGTADHITNSAYNGYGARTVSTSAPSGGADGDIWYQV